MNTPWKSGIGMVNYWLAGSRKFHAIFARLSTKPFSNTSVRGSEAEPCSKQTYSMSYPSSGIQTRSHQGRLLWLAIVIWLQFGVAVRAQDQTLVFSTSDAGISRAITNWGLDVTWANYDNVRRGLIFMGTNEVDMIRVPFLVNAPLTNADLSPAQKADLGYAAGLANMAGASKPWTMSCGTGAGVDPWFKSGNDVIPARWVQAMEAAERF
jgi:hypothetical protein